MKCYYCGKEFDPRRTMEITVPCKSIEWQVMNCFIKEGWRFVRPVKENVDCEEDAAVYGIICSRCYQERQGGRKGELFKDRRLLDDDETFSEEDKKE